MKHCIRCGQLINDNKKYCSKDCQYFHNKKQEIKTCKTCGNNFLAINLKSKYCSDKCRVNKRKDLKGSEWKSLRFDVLQRDGFKCVYCGRTISDGIKLHVDHIVPVAKGGQTVKGNLITACEDCNLGKSDKSL
jgi:5-methylcytosine-specific restriction endonuclease McrA